MTYRTQTSAQRYNARMEKIMERWRLQNKEKDRIARVIYKRGYDTLSDEKKRRVDYAVDYDKL